MNAHSKERSYLWSQRLPCVPSISKTSGELFSVEASRERGREQFHPKKAAVVGGTPYPISETRLRLVRNYRHECIQASLSGRDASVERDALPAKRICNLFPHATLSFSFARLCDTCETLPFKFFFSFPWHWVLSCFRMRLFILRPRATAILTKERKELRVSAGRLGAADW